MHAHPAGIGREIAADPAGALAAEAEREQAVRGLGGSLHSGQRAAGLGDQPLAARVDRADAVEAGEAEDNLVAALVGNAAAHQAGIAALRHQRHPMLGGEADEGCHLVDRAGAQDGRGDAIDMAPEVDLVGGAVGRREDDPLGADRRGAASKKGLGRRTGSAGHADTVRRQWAIG